jgi:hypothetical protein
MSRSNKVGPCFTKNESKVGLHTSYDIRVCLASLYHTGKDRLKIFLRVRESGKESERGRHE